ncbi:MAG: hypothetical protein ACK555_07425, partial [Acidobacteriota bacterium]
MSLSEEVAREEGLPEGFDFGVGGGVAGVEEVELEVGAGGYWEEVESGWADGGGLGVAADDEEVFVGGEGVEVLVVVA